MENRATVEEQLGYLKLRNVEVDDESELREFLQKYPYQKTIKQVKFIYKINGNEYRSVKSSEMIKDYNWIFKDSVELLGSILLLENEIKNYVFLNLFTLYDDHNELYSQIIVEVMKITKNAFKHAYQNGETDYECCECASGHANDCRRYCLYQSEIYRIINACSLNEIGNIIKLLVENDVFKYKEICESILNPSDQLLDVVANSALKEVLCGSNILTTNINSNEIKKMFESQFDNLILKALLENDYPPKVILSSESLLRCLSNSVIKSAFDCNKTELIEWHTNIDLSKKKRELKVEIQHSGVLKRIKSELFERNKYEIVAQVIRKVFLVDEKKPIGIININKSILCNDLIEENENMSDEIYKKIVTKFFALISQFRNTIAHGQTLITPLKNNKEIIYKRIILTRMIENYQFYIELITRNIK
ncbi:hypothetical protein RZE82_04225 [Mollicutes bacterium LVI A0039]|nr:hypothetical protein RZE82_04225 [Mollicutes bacterium LVI A0039]